MNFFKWHERPCALLLISLLFLSNILTNKSYGFNPKRSVITDPAITLRCKEITDKREQKLAHKLKLQALKTRSKRLLSIAPPNKKTIKKQLQQTYKKTIRELIVTKEKIHKLEEQIVRKGCPGINI